MLVQYVIYADFESLTTKLKGQSGIQNRAILKTHNFTRYAVIVILLYDVMAKREAHKYTTPVEN